MKYLPLVIFALFTHSIAFGAVATSFDQESDCTLYQAIQENENGEITLEPGQRLFSSSRVYGLSFLELEIDFDRHEARVQTMMNVVLGLNKTLVSHKSVIKESNPEFTMLINQVNRRVSLFEKICISSNNEIIYAKFFPNAIHE